MKLDKNTFIKRWVAELENRGFKDIEFDFENRGFEFHNFNMHKLVYSNSIANKIINDSVQFYTELGFGDEYYVDNTYIDDNHFNFSYVPARVERITEEINDLFRLACYEINEEIQESIEMGEL